MSLVRSISRVLAAPASLSLSLAALAPGLFPFPLPADILLLQNGQTIEGEVADKGESLDVRTKYGSLTVAKADVKRRLKDVASLKAEVDVLHKSAKGMAEEGLKEGVDAADRGVKLEAAATLYERAIALANDAREAFTGSDAESLAAAAAAMGEELARIRARLGPATLAPPTPPPSAGAKPAPEGLPVALPPAVAKAADLSALAAVTAPSRRPLPPADRLRAAEAQVRDLFKADYRSAGTDERKVLARKLLQTALGTKDEPESQLALFNEARAVAAQAPDAETAVTALRETARRFDIDPAREVSATLGRLEAAVKTPEVARETAEAYLRAGLEAMAADEIEIAQALLARADRVARAARDPALIQRALDLAKDAKDQARELAAFRPAVEKLSAAPDDPAANATVGQYLCFVKSDWKRGLPFLARGGDADLKALAEAELAGPATADEKAALGDRWAAWGDRQPAAAAKSRGRERALVWYDAALPGLAGASKAKVEKRVQDFLNQIAAQYDGMVQPGNVALAALGAVAEGSSSAAQLIDGIKTGYTGSTGFASLSWPGEWVVTLPKTFILRQIRFLLWDGDSDRYYKYVVETSPDGKTWVPLVDRSRGKWRSWQTLDFPPRRVKAIRVKGLYNSANSGFYIVELEAFCQPPAVGEKPRAESDPTDDGPPARPRRGE